MKFTVMALMALASLATAEENVGVSDCNVIRDEQKCLSSTDDASGTSCVWCTCQAVPSVCVTEEQAHSLPAGVFQCSATDNDNSEGVESSSSDSSSSDETETVSTTAGFFQFVEGRSHHLQEVPHGTSDLCDASSKSISGYMDIKGSKYDQNGEDKHLFFWMFEKRPSGEDLEDDEIPFVVWLTGGPGCSSTLALLTENGPCSVNSDGKTTTVNPFSWTEAAHVLWLDQPAGVGFSYGAETDTGEEMVSEDAYYFLQAFFQTHPEYVNSPLYIIGESYAGVSMIAIGERKIVPLEPPSPAYLVFFLCCPFCSAFPPGSRHIFSP